MSIVKKVNNFCDVKTGVCEPDSSVIKEVDKDTKRIIGVKPKLIYLEVSSYLRIILD